MKATHLNIKILLVCLFSFFILSCKNKNENERPNQTFQYGFMNIHEDSAQLYGVKANYCRNSSLDYIFVLNSGEKFTYQTSNYMCLREDKHLFKFYDSCNVYKENEFLIFDTILIYRTIVLNEF